VVSSFVVASAAVLVCSLSYAMIELLVDSFSVFLTVPDDFDALSTLLDTVRMIVVTISPIPNPLK
jgi:hypothetical protein